VGPCHEILIGEGIGLFSRLFTDRYVVRSGVEKFGLILYSFWMPTFILFIMFSLILGIISDAFGEEKEELTELEAGAYTRPLCNST